MDEFKITEIKENPELAENTIIRENPNVAEAAATQEIQGAAEFTEEGFEERVQPRRRRMSVTSMAAGTVAAISAAAVGITGMLNVNMAAKFENVTVDNGAISYSVVVTDMTEEETLSLDVFNDDQFLYTLELIDDNHDGVIDGKIDLDLDSDEDIVNYRLNLKGLVGLDVTRNFDSYVVKSERKQAAFDDLECWCNCGVDGNYYFKMNFEDNFGLFSDFTAQITDAYGNVSICKFSEDLHEPQKIYVMSLTGATGKLKISYLVDHTEEKIIEQDVHF